MQVQHTKPLPTGQTIEIGDSTWENGKERSVRVYYRNAKGGFSTGSPEVPMHDIEPMLAFLAEKDELTPGACARIIEALEASLRRRP